MRIVLGIVLALIGIPALIAGVVAAVYVGTDNRVELVQQEVSSETAIIASDASVLEITGPTLHVTADAGEGGTFVGVAHPVHVDSLLTDVGHTQVSDVGWRSDLTATPVAGDANTPATNPAELDWWRDASSGTGPQHVAVDLTDEPFRVVIAGADPEAPVTAQLLTELEIDGLFTTAVLVAAAGLALLVVAVILLRRRKARGRRRGEPARDTEAPPAETTESAPPRPDAARRSATLPRAAVAVSAVGFLAAGCAQLPGDADRGAHTTVVSVTPEAANAFFEEYTDTNNRANAEQDAELISTVENGTLLRSSQMAYEIQQAQDRDPIEPFTITPSLVAAPRFDSYPMWFLAVSNAGQEESSPGYHVVTREDAASSWQASMSVYPSAEAQVPEPAVDDGVATVAGDDAEARGGDVLGALLEYAETGEEPDGIDVSEAGGVNGLHEHGLQIVEGPEEPVTVDQECSVHDDDLHWLTTDTGAMGVAAISCTQDVTLDEGYSLTLDSEGYGTIPGETHLSELTITHGVTFIVELNDDGSAAVFGEALLPYEMDYTEDEE